MRPVLFVNVGWGEKYDGSEIIRGGHRYLKEHGDDCSEMYAFKPRRGLFRCGIGKGKVTAPRFDVALVARQPDRAVHRIVGMYKNAWFEPELQEGYGVWGWAVTRTAHGLPVGARPEIKWPGAMGMRRWADNHPELKAAYANLRSRRIASGSRPRARRRVFVYRWGTNPSLWTRPRSAHDALEVLRRACVGLDNDVRWEIGPTTRTPAGSKQIRVGDVVLFYAGKRFGSARGIYGIALAGTTNDTTGDLAVHPVTRVLPVRWLPCSRRMAATPVRDFERTLAPPGPAYTLLRLTRVSPRLQGLIDRAVSGHPLDARPPPLDRRMRDEVLSVLEGAPAADRTRIVAEVRRLVRNARLRPLVLSVWPPRCAACGRTLTSADGDHEVEVAHLMEVRDGGIDDLLNVIPLCRTHHWAFDRRLWAINPKTMAIVITAGARRQDGLREIEGNMIERPDFPHAELPGTTFLARRWNQFSRRKLAR